MILGEDERFDEGSREENEKFRVNFLGGRGERNTSIKDTRCRRSATSGSIDVDMMDEPFQLSRRQKLSFPFFEIDRIQQRCHLSFQILASKN